MTARAEIDRAIELAVAELRRHGGTEADIEAMRRQFKQAADDEENRLTGKSIQD